MATHAGVKLSNHHREEIDKASEVTIICQASFWSRSRWIFLDAELQRRLKGVYLFDFILGHFALEFSNTVCIDKGQVQYKGRFMICQWNWPNQPVRVFARAILNPRQKIGLISFVEFVLLKSTFLKSSPGKSKLPYVSLSILANTSGYARKIVENFGLT